jgi:ABC-2 type transport system ATP-binding protein
MNAVFLDNVSYVIHGKTILQDISLEIKKGSITGILGPNGAGKTTLLSLINGLRTHTSGTVKVLDQVFPVKDAKFRRQIGVVLQETALYDELTTTENLRFSASLYGVDKPEKRIMEVLDLLKLSDRSDEIVCTLSGGLRRRVAIARALIHDPQLLIIDEPTLGVDVEARHAIWSYLRLLRSKGRTVIVATNYLDEAQALCDTAAVLKKGVLIVNASPHQLVNQTGSCLDIECDESASKAIINMLHNSKEVHRIDQTPSGLSLFLKDIAQEKHVLETIMKHTHIDGFRSRSPDLAEVFSSIEKRI